MKRFWGSLFISIFLVCTPLTRAEDALPLVQLAYHQQDQFEWWTHEGIELNRLGVNAYQVAGNGRVILHTGKTTVKVQSNMLTAEIAPKSTVFLDQVGNQVRVMVLNGKSTLSDRHRVLSLTPSLQVVVYPPNHAGPFIDDGVYRRAIRERFEESNTITLVRQFYLEQVVYTDPMLRTLYQEKGSGKSLVRELNENGAILRELDGTAGYEPGQV